MATKSLHKLLNTHSDGALGDVVRKAQDMGRLTHILAQVLPPDDAQAIVAANIREDGELVVLAASPAWAARLRFLTDSLIDAAKTRDPSVTCCTGRGARQD